MKKITTLLALCLLFCMGKTSAQSFSPISLTGYNWDAVAEATTAVATTSGAIDGSNYVLYSVSYGTVYNVTTGLPNNGLITSGTSTYQLAPYNANNMLFVQNPNQIDSLTFTTPAPYSGVSILCFSTEGNGTSNITVRFTDNTTQIYNSQNLTDWFSPTTTGVYSGFDRLNRSGTTPSNAGAFPKMYAINLPISCANRAKSIRNIKFSNSGTNPRNCFMAISGAAMPGYSIVTSPVTCSGGSNGSATITANGGIQPYTFGWSTLPVQSGATAGTLSAGVYSVIAQDGGLCPVTLTTTITQSLVPQPDLSLSANIYTICAGKSVTLNVSGANTYTWNTSANTLSITANPSASTTYTVGGYTSFNCYRTGSLTITVNPLPVINFTTPANICLNAPQFSLNASPANGTYAGSGITLGAFFPNFAGAGTKTLSYTYTDANGCVGVAVNTIIVNALPVLTFTLSPNSLCTNSSTLALTATPSNGTFTGTGVTGSVYTPSVAGAGAQNVSYSYTDANNCTVVLTSSVIINAAPTPVFQTTKKLYCVFNPTLYLNAQPSGGVFTGPGTTTAGIFSPTLAGVGTPTITYVYTDPYGCSGKAVFTATVSACNAIGENTGDAVNLLVYPNPNNGSFTIKAGSHMDLNVMNDLGQVVKTLQLEEGNAYEVSVADLPGGIYFVTGQTGQQLLKQKIIVTK